MKLLGGIVVLISFGVAAALLVPPFHSGSDPEVRAARWDISKISTALVTFRNENGRYPTTNEGLEALVHNPGNLPNWSATLGQLPQDPWGRPYVYLSPGREGDEFDLHSTGPSGRDGNADNVAAPFFNG